jgi:hypothetical protein
MIRIASASQVSEHGRLPQAPEHHARDGRDPEHDREVGDEVLPQTISIYGTSERPATLPTKP